MPRAKTKGKVVLVVVYPSRDGIRYTCRGEDGRVVYDSARSFRSRRDARAEARRRWPKAKITFDVT